MTTTSIPCRGWHAWQVRTLLWLFLAAMGAIASPSRSRADEPKPVVVKDLLYATAKDHALKLDLYTPSSGGRGLVVWIHGGAWRRGSKSNMPLRFVVDAGYAVASVDYRLSPVAQFPAQVHDCKAAIRFLRKRQSEYAYDATRVAIAGSSAGGHLAALVGVTNGHLELEGELGNRDTSSSVQAIVDYYGPTNFLTILKQSTPHGLGVRIPALQLLLGGQPEDRQRMAKLASPVFHVDPQDPPLLMLHGDQDPQVPINQSHELQGAYRRENASVALEVVHGGAHGGEPFFDKARQKLVLTFLAQHLRPAKHVDAANRRP